MFFKRETPRVLSFSEQMDALRSKGYTLDSAGQGVLVKRAGLGALVREGSNGKPQIVDTGLVLNGELAVLTDVGFQKIFLAPSGHKTPGLAEHLRALHNFVEDLREELGLTSLYNEGLGTTNEKHLYDRVTLRDRGRQPKPWEKN